MFARGRPQVTPTVGITALQIFWSMPLPPGMGFLSEICWTQRRKCRGELCSPAGDHRSPLRCASSPHVLVKDPTTGYGIFSKTCWMRRHKCRGELCSPTGDHRSLLRWVSSYYRGTPGAKAPGVRSTVHSLLIYSAGTSFVSQTPFSDRKKGIPSRCILPASTVRTTGCPWRFPTLPAVSRLAERWT